MYAARRGRRALRSCNLRSGRPKAAPTADFGKPAGGASPSPTIKTQRFGVCVGEALGPPARICTSPRLLGKARRGGGTAPVTIFHSARAQWPGGNLDTHSDFARRKGFKCETGAPPVKGARGKAVIGEQSSPLRRPPAAFWLLCRRGQSNPPSADGGIPCNTARRGRRALRPEKGCSLIAPSSVWPSASHLPPRGKAFAGEGLQAADSRPYTEERR